MQKIVRPPATFGEWILPRLELLFLPKRDPNYSLVSIYHFFTKRLGITPEKTKLMDEDERDELFRIEKQIFDKEIENQTGKKQW